VSTSESGSGNEGDNERGRDRLRQKVSPPTDSEMIKKGSYLEW